ncbi:MAG: dipeptidase [Cellulosilyticaceae bacterium]
MIQKVKNIQSQLKRRCCSLKIIDFHADTASVIYETKQNLNRNNCHIDIERLQKAGYTAQWFAFFIDIEKHKRQNLMMYLNELHTYFVKQIEANKDNIAIVTTYQQYCECKQNNKLAAFLSLEEGQIIENDISNIDKLVSMGIRLMTLTWNYANDLAFPHKESKGLTSFGKEVIRYLNDTPILLDISHLSESAMKDLKEGYHKPIIASHSNGKGFYNHTRNASDDIVRAIANSGGVIGVNFYNYFLGDTKITTIDQIIGSMRQLIQIGGEDTVVFGTDFDGIDCELEVCNCAEMDKLIDRMYQCFPSLLVDKICYKNAERLLRENF